MTDASAAGPTADPAAGRTAGRLTLIPKSWVSWDYRVLWEDREIAQLDRSWIRERASFTLDGEQYEARRTSLVRGTFVLERAGRVEAEAVKPSLFRRAFDIRVGAVPYRLETVSAFRREFRVLRVGVQAGRVRPASLFRRTLVAELQATIPLPVQLFLTFLVLVLWKRQQEAGAAGS